jgi:hypothetical protein
VAQAPVEQQAFDKSNLSACSSPISELEEEFLTEGGQEKQDREDREWVSRESNQRDYLQD